MTLPELLEQAVRDKLREHPGAYLVAFSCEPVTTTDGLGGRPAMVTGYVYRMKFRAPSSPEFIQCEVKL